MAGLVPTSPAASVSTADRTRRGPKTVDPKPKEHTMSKPERCQKCATWPSKMPELKRTVCPDGHDDITPEQREMGFAYYPWAYDYREGA